MLRTAHTFVVDKLPSGVRLGLIFLIFESVCSARSVFLNGADFSSARGQDLKNVNIHIDDQGNIFIRAPHYQVHEEETFVPLRKTAPAAPVARAPEHKAPQVVDRRAPTPEDLGEAIEPGPGSGSDDSLIKQPPGKDSDSPVPGTPAGTDTSRSAPPQVPASQPKT